MNINLLKGMILAALPHCPEPGCDEPIDDWPDADADEGPVMYVGRDAVFAGTCSHGHLIEFYLNELKAQEVVAHTRTERTLGRKISQRDCEHPTNGIFEIPEGAAIPTIDGTVEGPAHIAMCQLCGRRTRAVKREKPQTPPDARKGRGPLWTP